MLVLSQIRRAGVDPVDLSVPAGGCVAIIGPSGAGKTLLLRAVADLDPHDGEVTLNGTRCSTMPAPAWRRRVVYVPAESGWWAETVGEHTPVPDAAGRLASRLGLPDDVLQWPVSRLSTGEKQRLALVRAFSLKPPVLLLDEPTAALDADSARAVEALIRESLANQAAVLMVTHDHSQAERLAGEILLLRDGHIEREWVAEA